MLSGKRHAHVASRRKSSGAPEQACPLPLANSRGPSYFETISLSQAALPCCSLLLRVAPCCPVFPRYAITRISEYSQAGLGYAVVDSSLGAAHEAQVDGAANRGSGERSNIFVSLPTSRRWSVVRACVRADVLRYSGWCRRRRRRQ